ncbi:YggS family pyridoxal phosphate-dependent enzyme [Alishewanella tabrizica]|uniref:Pyridoxal phosphate homeostasis protein n=1 Tax=Alishewanella tabrizica TaxID=671278 RepID=A0ABQ2WEV6_9ALTE|nr:YggS family pyridoxal phosphate-dependent enzyme [Alishewanella tabrizica]GGW50331.1 YggS family pyridoxal phosphate enzyme [Alishewanella tabrizica]
MMNNIAEQLALAYHQLAKNCEQAHVPQERVKLIAVSKTKPNSAIEAAFAANQRQFGENYPQELATKADALQHLTEIEWHFIGPLQSNKTRLVAENASWVHSIDRLKIAQRLSEQRPVKQGDLKILLQINISQEEAKSGIAPDHMLELAAAVSALPNLTLRGLMAIPAPGDNTRLTADFAAMQQLSLELQKHYPDATELSMGMSDDWPLALRYGATMIRLGTAIFGARNYD